MRLQKSTEYNSTRVATEASRVVCLRWRTLGGSHCDGAAGEIGLLRFRRAGGMCYNRRAVRDAGKQEMALRKVQGGAVVRSESTGSVAKPAESGEQEDASRYCPVCSQQLESKRCKLICNTCGYYMSCADYY